MGLRRSRRRYDDHRTADRIDPTVDHSADDYQPEVPDRSRESGTISEPGTGPTDDRWRSSET